MTNKYKEAFETLTDWFHSYTDDSGIRVHERHITKSYEEAKKTISELVEKATPKKPVEEFLLNAKICPNCENLINVYEGLAGCPYCLQAIDWDEEE